MYELLKHISEEMRGKETGIGKTSELWEIYNNHEVTLLNNFISYFPFFSAMYLPFCPNVIL